MSRGRYQTHREAMEAWPRLSAFLKMVCHGDDDRRVQVDCQDTIEAMMIGDRQALAREWWHWNATAGAGNDVRFAIEAFDPGIAFDTASHARAFMNDIYDRLIVSIRQESGRHWKP